MTELEPCPWCGGQAQLLFETSAKEWFVCCKPCNIYRPPVGRMVHTREEAINEWNRRTSPTVPQEMPESVREAIRKAEQLAEIASDWHLDEVEIDGEMVSIYDLRDEFKATLALLDSADAEGNDGL